MTEAKCDYFDRRSGKDRRIAHSANYFFNGGVDRRGCEERRSHIDRSAGSIKEGKPIGESETSEPAVFKLWFGLLCSVK